jgi:hypothetical protein
MADESVVETIEPALVHRRRGVAGMDVDARTAFLRVAELQRLAIAAELEMVALGVSFAVMRDVVVASGASSGSTLPPPSE